VEAGWLGVVVVTFHTGPALADCLPPLLNDPCVAEVVLVDNGNPPAMREWLKGLAAVEPRLRLIEPGRNLGFAAGCNLGAQLCGGTVLAFVNPDLRVPPGTFAHLGRLLADRPDAWLLGGRLLNMDGTEQRGGRREVLTPWRAAVEVLRLDRLAPDHPHFRRLHLLDQPAPAVTTAVPVVSGAFMVMPRDRFEALGGFDDEMFLHMEDVDLCLRVLNHGGMVLYCGDVPVYHQQGSSDAAQWWVEWHKTRGTIRYFTKHFSSTYPRWGLKLIAAMLWGRLLLVGLRHLPSDMARLWRRFGA
jgi:GT2 family glycosyltransferase